MSLNHVYVSSDQMSAEKEITESDRLFASIIRTAEEARVAATAEIVARQKFAAMRSEELIEGLQKEIAELQRRNDELEKLSDSEDHLHLLQVQSWLEKLLSFLIEIVLAGQRHCNTFHSLEVN